MNCREAIDMLADYLDATVTPNVVAQRESHLDFCAPCRAYVATYKRSAELAVKASRVEMPRDVAQRLRDFLGAHENFERNANQRSECGGRHESCRRRSG